MIVSYVGVMAACYCWRVPRACVYGSEGCVGRALCLRENAGRWHASAPVLTCVCGLRSCSLEGILVGDAGAAAIGAGLVHLPQLQTLKWVVCPAVCAGLWCALVRERGAWGDGMRL